MHSADFINKVRQLYGVHKNYRKVAKLLKMSHTTVMYMIKNNYDCLKKKTGPKKKINSREKTKIKKEARRLRGLNQRVSARKIKANCDISTSLRTVQRTISTLGFNYGKIQKKLPLTAKHKKLRIQLARKWIAQNIVNKNLVFSDEKKFKFDGPDNWCSWYDPFDPLPRIKRQMGGGGIMVWGMTLPSGEIYVRKLEGKVDSDKYISLIKHHVKPYLKSVFKDQKYIFQQDGCSIHTSKKTTTYLKSAKIDTLEWPSMSPDLNIQENIWKMLSDVVYDQKQFYSADLLWKAIEEAVLVINTSKKETIKSIYENYNSRLLKVIDNKGNDIPY